MVIRNVLIACVVSFGLFGSAVADLNSGLVTHYKFDGNANDSSSNGNHGLENGGVSYTSGRLGNALKLNGVDGQVTASGSGSLVLTTWTISYFINPESFPSYGATVVGKHEDSNGRVNFASFFRYLPTENYGIITSQYETAESDDDHYIWWGSINLNEWSHVVSTRDASGMHRLYVNGVLVVEQQFSADTPRKNNENLVIGGPITSSANYFHGLIDEVRIYNRALSASEIKDVYEYNPNCSASDPASVALNLDIYIPTATYQSLGGTSNIWVDLEYKGVDNDGDIVWRLKNYGAK